ncbi:MAG: response regulator transcription factor [Terracidiphilus sp.]
MTIRVLLADDHELVRQGLKLLLEREGFNVVGEASEGQMAVQMVLKVSPDVAIFDIGMPILNGLDAARELRRTSPRTKTILLTRHDENQYVTEALRAGVKGYVLKNQESTDLVHAIRQVSRGEIYLSPSISRIVAEAFLSKTTSHPDPLTSRERQVLQLIVEGKSTKEIADVLGISVKTAETHRTRLMQKLDIHDVASLVRYAIRHGLVVL